MKLNKVFVWGIAGGVLITLTLSTLIRLIASPRQPDILAEVGGQKLTREELQTSIASDLIPIENDEYRILEQGVENWRNDRLLEKEAKAQGVNLEELYRKEIWTRVQVSYEDTLAYYNKNRELYNEPLEKISPQIAQELRRAKYSEAKEKYLVSLAEKYKTKIYLKKPKAYVEGLALPAPRAESAQPFLPSAALPTAAPIEGKSKIGQAPVRGNESAPITIMEFADFHCHFCKKVAPTLDQLLKNYPDKVRLVWRHFPLSTTPGTGSFLTHEASVCAQEQGKFWEFHDAVYALEGTPNSKSDIEMMGQKIGLDKKKFLDCLNSGKNQPFLQEELNEGKKRGVSGTPTLFVNDKTIAGAYPYEYFVNAIEAILHPDKAAAFPPTPLPQVPPAVVKFTDLEGRPSLGPKDAVITLVEFSDFHCPFCKRVTPTLEELMKNYPGKIRRIWRQYPLSMHAGADRTAEASECANDQGKFWSYHDKLFETQGTPWDDAALISLAPQAGLDKKKFEKCLTSGKFKDLVQKEIAKGNEVGVQGTPAVFVNGKLVSGAQPYENFDQIIKAELQKS